MKEELVSFKIAQLAKEKGFDDGCLCYCQKTAIIGKDDILPIVVCLGKTLDEDNEPWIVLDNLKLIDWNIYGNDQVPYYSIPTKTQLQSWLRREHKIHVWLVPTTNFRNYNCYVYKESVLLSSPVLVGNFENYDDALEEGLVVGLKMLSDTNKEKV